MEYFWKENKRFVLAVGGGLLFLLLYNGFVLGCLSTEVAARNLRKQPVPQDLVLKPAIYDKSNYEKFEPRVEMKKCPTLEEVAAE